MSRLLVTSLFYFLLSVKLPEMCMFVCDSVVSVVNGFCVTKLTSWPQTVCVCVCVCGCGVPVSNILCTCK